MRARALIVLLLPVATWAGGPAEQLARRLGDPDPFRRRIATWPALEPAARSDDPEVCSRARRILRAWAWIPPHLRAVLDGERRRALLGADREARSAVADLLRTKAGDAGREAREHLFAAWPATFRAARTSMSRRACATGCATLPVIPVGRRPGSACPPSSRGGRSAGPWSSPIGPFSAGCRCVFVREAPRR